MFAYIDPEIRSRLINTGKLIRIDAGGRLIDTDSPVNRGLALNILGPIPLPVLLGDRKLNLT